MPDAHPIDASHRPLVSVVMANRNGAAHIGAAVGSVLGQTLRDLELIVSDDASTDDSRGIVAGIAATDPRVTLLAADMPGGPAAARNRALDVARGDWIAVVDSDDLMHPTRLARLVALARDLDAPAIADDLIFFTIGADAPPRRLLQSCAVTAPRALDAATLLAPAFAGGPNELGYLKPLISRRALGDLRYRADLRIGEDFDLLLRLALTGHPVTLVPEALYLYRRHAGSVSHRLPPEAGARIVAALGEIASTHPDLPAATQNLIAARRTAVARMAAREGVLQDLKARRLLSAARGMIRTPAAASDAVGTLARVAASRLSPASRRGAPEGDLWLAGPSAVPDGLPAGAAVLRLTGRETPDDWARLAARTAGATGRVRAIGAGAEHALGFVPLPGRTAVVAGRPAEAARPLVHVRCPTYRRPEALRRALQGLQAQTHTDWVCDVHDDDPDGSGATVVADLADPRIRHAPNRPQLRASKNIDRCFTRENPHGARYFCVLEDDNQLLAGFLEDNIRICRDEGVEIVLRNQLVEHASGTVAARLGDRGLLDTKFVEGLYAPERFRLALMADMGVSNGGLFWTRDAMSDLEVHVDCSATLQEYFRTLAIREPIYIAMTPLAVWAENGAETTRDLGETAGWLRRELSLKRSVQILQRHIWTAAPRPVRDRFLEDEAFRYPPDLRATGLIKSLTRFRVGRALPAREVVRLTLRGLLIRVAGRPEPGVAPFLDRLSRAGGQPG
jgi:glycosyltransferase involved in cell wall biosynthesis